MAGFDLEKWLHTSAALIFDCDGTLVDTMPAHYRAWCRALLPYGCVFPEPVFYSWGGTPPRRIIERLNEEQGLAMPVLALAEIKESYFMEESRAAVCIPETVAIVQDCLGKIPMAIASGGPREVVHATLRAADLFDAFPVMVTSCDVLHGKPAPDTYLLAAEMLGVKPADCLVFEDADTGVRSALAAGCRCIRVTAYEENEERRFILAPASPV